MNIDELYTAQKVLTELLDRHYIDEYAYEDITATLGCIELGDYEGLEEEEQQERSGI